MKYLFHFYDLKQRAGIQRAICELSNALVKHGHEVVVATHTAQDQIAYTISPEVDVVRTPYPEYANSGILAWPRKTWWAIRQAGVLRDLIQKYRPSMVVDHGTAFGLVYPFGSLLGVPLVLQRHFPVRSFPRGRLLYRLLSLICWSKTTVVLTHTIADDMRALGYRKVRIVPNMIPAEAEPTPYSRAVPKTGLLLGRGRTPQKGFDVFLKALARTRESDGWKFAIIGPGIESDPVLLELINRHGLASCVALLPATSDPYEHIRNSACLIVPSRYEGLPMVALEALRIGRPVIASDADGLRDVVIDGLNGFTFPVGDVEKLSQCLSAICTQPGKLKELAANASASVGRFDVHAIVAEWDALSAALQKELEKKNGN